MQLLTVTFNAYAHNIITQKLLLKKVLRKF